MDIKVEVTDEALTRRLLSTLTPQRNGRSQQTTNLAIDYEWAVRKRNCSAQR
jgi:hypothetical protein